MYKKISLFVFIVFVLKLKALAYTLTNIPIELFENANSIILEQKVKYTFVNDESYIYSSHKVIAILNNKCEAITSIFEPYDKFDENISIDAFIYDSKGELIKKIKNKDIQDFSNVGEISLYDDNRIKKVDLNYFTYPYFIEINFQKKVNQTFAIDSWIPLLHPNQSILKSTCEVEFSKKVDLNYFTNNITSKVDSIINNKTLYSWKLENYKAVDGEPLMPTYNKIFPVVNFTLKKYTIESKSGNMNTWNDLGKFIYQINSGSQELPDDVKNQIHKLVKDKSSIYEKVKTVYEYLQQSTRYISVQLGLGGWKPFDAKYVAKNGYGDCKALSNYMLSLLQEINIPAYYTLIKAGRNNFEIQKGFPSSQFNHAIICVPNNNDTIWLECTSKTLPCGYLSSFTNNRDALLVYENGGSLIKTPTFNYEKNIIKRDVIVDVSDSNSIIANVNTNYLGQTIDEIEYIVDVSTQTDLKNRMKNQLSFTHLKLDSINYIYVKNKYPSITEKYKLEVEDFGNLTESRFFFQPYFFAQKNYKLHFDKNRKFPFIISDEYSDTTIMHFNLPSNYKIESKTEDVLLDSKFGKYKISYFHDGSQLKVIRIYQQFKGEFNSVDFEDYTIFLKNIYNSDNSKLVFLKQ